MALGEIQMNRMQMIEMLKSAQQNMMTDSMFDYAIEQIEVVLAELKKEEEASRQKRKFFREHTDDS